MYRRVGIITGITLVGTLFRLFILSQRGSFWFDEAFSAHFAAMDLREMWGLLKFENNPPLYFAILHFWMKWFGNSELVVRSLSMIFGITSIPMVYALGVRLFAPLTPPLSLREREAEGRVRTARNAGLFAAFLTAISTFQVFYSTETRMYSLYLFLTLTSVWLFLDMSRQGLRRSGVLASVYRFVALFIVLLVLVWTHITAWMIIAALAFYLFWQSQFTFKKFFILHSSFLITIALVALSFLPWTLTFIKLKIAAPLSQGYFFYIPPSRNYFIDILETFLVFGQQNAFVITLLSAVMGTLLWFAVRGTLTPTPLPQGEGRVRGVKFLLCWLFIPLFIGFAFQNAIPRYFIAVAPALYLLMGIGFANLLVILRSEATKNPVPNRTGSFTTFRMTLWAFPLLIFVLIMPDYASLREVAHHEWDNLAQWVEQSEGIRCQGSGARCLIVVNPHSEVLPFERYYKGALPAVGFYPKDDHDSRDLRIVKTNWISLNTKENVRALADVTAGYDRVFLISGEIDQTIGRNLVPLWFWENGWRKIAGGEFGKGSAIILERNSL